ncbi:oxygenase MpaB family protein [Herbaspirillum sp. RV1423]|uniref:oxygenase MpaB family protein n=1 Tax=Herbaspirillum sp. RV1423 TaxID=1443993 RepID=UPI0004B98ADF|nr:oxygenase MpaB family protein [Herbaspirillum sp. RV1423]
MEALRTRIEASVIGISRPPGSPDFRLPKGDPGLFGPASACWQVHSDFTAMLIGGVSALLLQMLHPLPLAGVWDHSTFQQDMLGRLRRTAQFIAGTTYGSSADAERLIARVRHIHGAVRGVAADGRVYAADDPELLTWVHAAEVSSFLRAYVRYRHPAFSPERQNQYLDEIALIAQKLGARNVPRNLADMQEYIENMRPQLRCEERTLKTLGLVMNAPSPHALAVPWTRLMMHAGVDLLPDWAKQQLGVKALRPLQQAILHQAVAVAAKPVRWAVRQSSAQLARQRVTGA